MGLARRSRSVSWVGFGLSLMFVMTVGSIMQFGLGVISPLILDRFEISKLHFGLLNSGFYIAVALSSIFLSRHIGLWSDRTVALAIVISSSVALALVGASNDLLLFAIGTVAASLAAGLCNPLTNRAATRAAGREGIVAAIKQTGVSVAMIGCGALLPWMIVALGWRNGFFILAIVLLVFGCLIIVTGIKSDRLSPPNDRKRYKEEPRVSEWPGRSYRVYSFCVGFAGASIAAYVALYAHDHLNFSVDAAGGMVAFIGLGAVVGRIAWGMALADKPSGSPAFDRSLVMMTTFACVAVLPLVFGSSRDVVLTFSGIALGGSVYSWNVVAMLAIIRNASVEQISRVSGGVLAYFFAGLAVGPSIFVLVSSSMSYASAWSMVLGLYMVASIAMCYSLRSSLAARVATSQ